MATRALAYDSPPLSPTSPFPFLPLEIQLDILSLSTPPDTVAGRAERRRHLERCSRVCRAWKRPAQKELFGDVEFDLRAPGSGDGEAEARSEALRARTVGLKQLAYKAKRLKIAMDDTENGAMVHPFRIPWRVWIVDDYRGVAELEVELWRAEVGGRNTWEDEVLAPIMPTLQALTLIRGGHSSPHLSPDVYLSASSLTRLTLIGISFISWFPPASFPSVRTLICDRLSISETYGQPRPSRNLFLPFPALQAAAFNGTDLLDLTFSEAPEGLKHLLLGQNSYRAAVPGARRAARRAGLDSLVSLLPSSLTTLSLYPNRRAPPVADLAALLQRSPVPPCLLQLKELNLPRTEEWIDPGASESVRFLKVVELFCENRGVRVKRWEEGREWEVRDWRCEEDE
ncbi:hypothetical protein JCM10213_008401 [Rhodosporidiobolus nylandii]